MHKPQAITLPADALLHITTGALPMENTDFGGKSR
jgi:hypothetical protein